MRITALSAVVVFSSLLFAATPEPAKTKTYIDMKKCSQCNACIDVCPSQAIAVKKIDGKKVVVIDPAKCDNCGDCSDACPDNAIIFPKIAKGAK